MSWRSRTHPSGIKIPACPSRERWLSRKHCNHRVQKSPVLQAMGVFPAGCTVMPRYPLLLLAALESTHGSWRRSSCEHLFGGWMLQLLLLLQLGFSGLSWHYLLCPGSDGIAVVLQWLWGSLWQRYRLWWTKNQPALCENQPFLILWFFFLGTGRKIVSALVHVGWIIAVFCLWAERIESLCTWD